MSPARLECLHASRYTDRNYCRSSSKRIRPSYETRHTKFSLTVAGCRGAGPCRCNWHGATKASTASRTERNKIAEKYYSNG